MIEPLEFRRLLNAYYVSPSGSNNNPGTSSAPWQTLQKAADSVVAGDTVTVRAGTYAGFVLGWDFPQNGTAAAPITFQADASAAPGSVIINSRNNKTTDGINLEGASYIVIDGFTINNASGTITRAGIRAVNDNHVTIRNNTTDNCGTWGIFTGFSNDVLIEDNVTSHAQSQHGIYVSNSGDRPVIRGNVSFGNHEAGIHMNGDSTQGGDGIISDALVEDNIIYSNGVAGGSGINCDGVQDSVFRNNLLYDNHASGVSLFREDGGGSSSGNVLVNNTIIEASDARWAVNIANASTGNVVFNNILYNNNPAHGAIEVSSDSFSGFQSDYNVVDGRFSRDGGNTVVSLSAWRNATGQDAHSIVSTPSALFVNVADNDYRLKSGSPAMDTGVSSFAAKTAPATDLVGTARPQGPGFDIGAYEQAAADTTPPTIVSASELYQTSPIRLTITFSEDVSASLTASKLLIHNLTTGGTISATGLSYNSATNTATFTLPTPLPDGNYRATLYAGSIADSAGNPLAADFNFGFFALAGDANHDRVVDVSDLGILATNWQGSGKSFGGGDSSYDGVVDVTDLGILATNWQKSLPAPATFAGFARNPFKPVHTSGEFIENLLGN